MILLLKFAPKQDKSNSMFKIDDKLHQEFISEDILGGHAFSDFDAVPQFVASIHSK